MTNGTLSPRQPRYPVTCDFRHRLSSICKLLRLRCEGTSETRVNYPVENYGAYCMMRHTKCLRSVMLGDIYQNVNSFLAALIRQNDRLLWCLEGLKTPFMQLGAVPAIGRRAVIDALSLLSLITEEDSPDGCHWVGLSILRCGAMVRCSPVSPLSAHQEGGKTWVKLSPEGEGVGSQTASQNGDVHRLPAGHLQPSPEEARIGPSSRPL
jgi:hypothetical protein